MSYKDEIKKQLKGVPHEFCVAFAARSALRVLPLLAAKERKGRSFWYWRDPVKIKYLLAILTASRFGLACSLVHNFAFTVGADAAIEAADAIETAAADAAYAAYAAKASYATDATTTTTVTQTRSNIKSSPTMSMPMPPTPKLMQLSSPT